MIHVADAITYPVVETFHSVQGEGHWSGANAFFIRLGGCDVHCSWCDTKSSWPTNQHPPQTIAELVASATKAMPFMVVITGGEPLMHDLFPLSAALQAQGLRVHLETSGAHQFSGLFDWVTLSPKQFKPPHKSTYAHANELKIVVQNTEDLLWAETQADLVPEDTIKYLQPEWETLGKHGEHGILVEYILSHPQWRVSLQTHKVLGVR
ncbi:MAG: 7-carboxy-7-deazaguanine synthase QueE [Pseudanabaenaceae cyanobacterium]|jgi:7-carboxy-7-deazaguanine synthase